MVFDNANQLMQLACASMDVLRAINDLLQAPQLIGGEGTLETYSSEESKTYWLIFFLQNLCQSGDILAQLKFLQHLNKDTGGLLQGSLLKNEVLIAYLHLHHKFTFHSGGGHWIEKPWEDHHLDGEKLACFHEASVVLYYFYYGEPSEQLFAKQIIPNAMRLSRYSKMTFQAMASFYSDHIHIANPPLPLMGEAQAQATSKETHPILPMEFKLLSKSFCGLVLRRSWIMERKFGLGMEVIIHWISQDTIPFLLDTTNQE
ncbi:hypothetical protein SCHPADRAFT_962928 [Schizopora paradoxa]|uniref:Uncharacterized protein n=1 Tax=Schizopora paradoxa TaxID=27342 RepID=A0A0H2S1J4_9AGAM|nr:hypothetical protein SCHPADRAFT_962928 [Schizopora paradoxa]